LPKVSVVIPCYNYGRYLVEAVESVIAQTYRDFEIIIVNDGSPDNTLEVAKGLIEKYPAYNIRLIDQPNSGVAAARNNGITAAGGEYVLPLDADDMLEPTFLEETVAFLEKNPEAAFAYTEMQLFGEVSEEQRNSRFAMDYSFKKLKTVQFIPYCNLLRKSAWEAVGGYKKVNYEDWEFPLSLGEAGYRGGFIDKRLLLYRKHGDSLVEYYKKDRLRNVLNIRKMHPRLFTPRFLHPFGYGVMSAYIELSNLLFKRTGLYRLDVLFRKKIRDPIRDVIGKSFG
jgi:glycosyltransferase involved in cell wall biosynthesis